MTRDELIAAIGKVPDLTPSITQPPVLGAYAAWPVRGRFEGVNPCAYRETWQVLVVLPSGDRAATVLEGDRLIPPIYEALSSVGFVAGGEPGQYSPEEGGQSVSVLIFDMAE